MVRAKDHLFQAEVLFHPMHVTSEDHKGSEKDHLFHAEVLFHPMHVTSEDHKGGGEHRRRSEQRITCFMLKSFSTLCMLLVRIIRVVNIGEDQRKGSPVSC